MERREFLKALGLTTLAAGFPLSSALSENSDRTLAITIDDPNFYITPLFTPEDRDRRIRESLEIQHGLKAALFVCGQRVESKQGEALLQRWSDSGHLIGNHSYSHLFYHSSKVSLETFSEDLLRCEELLSQLPQFKKLFRFPFLKEGDTKEKRDGMRKFLTEHGYRIGHVTIDASDWFINDRLTQAMKRNRKTDPIPYRDYFIKHILDRATFYDQLAVDVLGSRIPHILLIHHNFLNALFLPELLEALVSEGWKLIDADVAFADSIYAEEPGILPAGESLIWALAKETGRFESRLRYPGEDGSYEKKSMDELGL